MFIYEIIKSLIYIYVCIFIIERYKFINLVCGKFWIKKMSYLKKKKNNLKEMF